MAGMGPNVKKLISQRMAVIAIPSGGGLADGIKFLSSKESIVSGAKEAVKWVADAISAIRGAGEPNPWKAATDEEIAAEVLRKIAAKKSGVSSIEGEVSHK